MTTIPIPSDLPAIYARVCAKMPECRVEGLVHTSDSFEVGWSRHCLDIPTDDAAAFIFTHWSMVVLRQGYLDRTRLGEFGVVDMLYDNIVAWRPDPISALAEYLENK